MASKAKTKPAQFNEIGKKGRFTGVELPHAPRRTFGISGNGGADDDDMFEDPYLAAMSPDKGGVGASGVKGKKKRGSERNAQFNEIGKKGRCVFVSTCEKKVCKGKSLGFKEDYMFPSMCQSS
ncbi:hypothetical protein BT69DRAFT_505417 [Atractiella rhizophila]|nr:hypothetical protein BT69DRAFT_505417 [Atractiella rhizophila]